MSDALSSADRGTDFSALFQQASTYLEALIGRESFPVQLATCLNGEAPAKIEDTGRSLVAVLEERLAERGENMAAGLNPELRIRYYEDRIESKLAAECPIAEWTPWKPALTECARNTGVVLTGTFGLAAVLVALKAAGISPLKIPLYAASPYSTAVIFAALAVLSGVAATHPEKVPTLMERERRKAREHVAAYFGDAQAAFRESAGKAEGALNAYFQQLREGNSTIS